MVYLFSCGLLFGQTDRCPEMDGWRIAIAGEGTLSQRINFIPMYDNEFIPLGIPAVGGKVGAECSFHFAKYFGVSLGFYYGTVAQFKLKYYHNGEYEKPGFAFRNARFQVPIKMEFHSPIGSSGFVLYGAIGVNLNNIAESIAVKIEENRLQETGTDGVDARDPYCMKVEWSAGEDGEVFQGNMRDDNGYRVGVDALMNFGCYYFFPYGDAIRMGLSAQYSFNNKFKGHYSIPYLHSEGTATYRHNCLGIEVAYVHCFKMRQK